MPNLVNRGEPNADLLRRQIEAVLAVRRPVVVVNSYATASQRAGTSDGRVQNGMLVETALSDGHWLLFASPLIPPPAVDPVVAKFSRASLTVWLSLSVVLGILLSMSAAQRLIKPLSELSIAVEHLGGSGDSPPIPASGARELRGTLLAFNRMQARLCRFNEDRTRMMAAMSHNLPTPPTRLRLHAELVEDRDHQQKMPATWI